MTREYYINGQCLVSVRGMTGTSLDIENNNNEVLELGLTDGRGRVTIAPNYNHNDYRYDDWGPSATPDVQWLLTDVTITMALIHFDWRVLYACISESAGGGTEGTMKGAGQPMGAGKEMYDTGNHYISLYLSSPNMELPWRFQACYLAKNPIKWQLGAQTSLVDCVWRAIPYSPLYAGLEMRSENIVVWDHNTDTLAPF